MTEDRLDLDPFRRTAGLLIAAALLTGLLAACGPATLPTAVPMTEAAPAGLPLAYRQFCARHPALCALPDAADPRDRVELDRATYARLSAVNRGVNRTVRYDSDETVFGMQEFWTLPDDAGDCEDFALLKLQQLLAQGFPRRALRLAIAERRDRQLHAVLAVDTSRGTFVLDSSYDAPVPWQVLAYRDWRREGPRLSSWRRVAAPLP